MRSFPSPFALKKYLKSPDLKLDPLPLVDLCLIALFFVLLGSRFIFSPGVTLDLPRSETNPLTGVPTVAVLSIQGSEMLLFEERVYKLDGLKSVLTQFVEHNKNPKPVLLVKMNRDVKVQTFLTVCDFAREAGFEAVQIAARQVDTALDPL